MSESIRIVNCCISLQTGLSRFDCENVSDDVESELNSSHYYAPSLAQRMHCHWHSPSQDVGNQSTMIRQISSSDCLAPKRNSSLCSLTSEDSNIPQHTSRRLSRTLSLRNTADERSNSNVSRNHDSHYRNNHLLSCSTFRDQEEKHSNENFTSYLPRKDYMSDTQESFIAHTRKDYLPPTRRALSLLDSKGRTVGSMSTNRGNPATSDCDINSKALDLDRVLPPLPYNAGSQGQRREVGRSSSSTRRCSMDVTGGPYGNHLNGSSHNLQHSSIQEEVAYDRPHHSSSLPSMAKTKEKKSVSSYGGKPSDKVNTELKNSCDHGVGTFYSSYLNPKSISYVSTMPSQLNNSKFKSVENSSSVPESLPGFRSKHQDKLLRKNNTNATSSSVSKGHSQIPSLLNFHSPSANTYAVEKQRNKDYPVNIEEGANCVRKPQSSSLLRCTPDRSILSKFFRQGPEEKDVTREVESANGDKDAAKKKRRISRFLRPDFFDTPREESIYAKEKDAKKAAEAENKLRLRRNLKQLVAENNGSQSQLQKPTEIGLSLLTEIIFKTDPVSASSDNINTDKDNINLMNGSRSEMEQTGEEKESGEQKKSANDMREKPDNINDIKKPEKRCSAFEKQPNNVTNKNRFLHSLEKKLEKFRSSVDSTPSANSCGKSRVDKAICSLREQSLTPRSGDVMTSESHLLKRAVSVSDCCTVESSSKSNVPSMKESVSSKLGNKVTSVLGLFRKLEDAPIKTHQSTSPRPSVLSRQKRTQSVYGGSHSDSVLLEPGGLEFKSVPPLHLKKTNSNSSVVKRKTLQKDGTIEKEDLENSKIIESQLQDPGLKKLENKTTRLTEVLTTDNMLGSETAHNSNIAHDRSVLEGSHATKQQESSVPKLLKRGSIKSKTKNSIETGNKTQPKSFSDVDSSTRSASVVEQGKSCKDQANISSELEGNIKSVRPGSLTGLKSVIPDNVIKVPDAADTSVEKKFLMSANTNECVRLMSQEAETGNSKDELDGNKNVYVRTKSAGEVSCNSCADAHKANEPKSCTVSEVPPTMDNVFDNSPVDDYSLNDDEVKFANVKRLDSCLYPANDSSVLSPADESESFDSWSVCSDFESHEYASSPVPLPGDDIEESVGDRIRRKSFYSRFNDIKKKHKKPPLSSIGSLSFSYRDPSSVSFLHPPRNFMRKKDHPADCLLHSSHSIYYPLKSHRSHSLYAQNDYDRLPPCSRKSPVLSKLQYNSLAESNVKPLVTKNVTRDRNGNVDDFILIDKSDVWDDNQKASVSVDEVLQTTSTVRENIPFLGGSVENLRMPRHFNHNVNFSTLPYQSLYSDTMIKASDSHLSRSNESGTGATIPKSCLPAVLDRHLSLPPRFDSNNSSIAVTSCPGSAVVSASVTGETSPLHGKYKRHNSHSLLNAPSSVCNGSPTAAGEDLYMESELPVTPDYAS
ncbi:hypothetical protein B7P43_G11585 [Cryptotermes secundus]|uniref:Uncharacterized protein n=1 Tax=Cryptotermes secundus TaxID=105785 RepID=A0A2J7QVV8_9NEOP|nr:hypothetical protein B7P43_G11585 [Cryptotermes secundus]